MGFLNKAATKTKTSLSTSSNKISESREVSKIESQIKDEKNKVKANYELIGKEYYRSTTDKDPSHKKLIEEYVDQINESRRLIEEYERQIEEVRAAAKEEREAMRAEADAKIREKEAEEEAARAEKAKQKKEEDDLF